MKGVTAEMVLVLLESKRQRTVFGRKKKQVAEDSLLKPLWQVTEDEEEKSELLVLFAEEVPTIDKLGLTIESELLAFKQEIENLNPPTPGTSDKEITIMKRQNNIVFKYQWDDFLKIWFPYAVNFFNPVLKNRFHNIEPILYDVLITKTKVSKLSEIPPEKGISVAIVPEIGINKKINARKK